MTDVQNAHSNENRPNEDPKGMVVGIDGSPGSNHALAWARRRTDRFGMIRPVTAWQYPWWAVSAPMPLSTVPAYDELSTMASHHGEEVISSVPEGLRDPLTVVQSAAGPTLVEQAEDAALLVVGTRGRGAISDKLLGSVSCHAVSHSSVPVAVVPPKAPLDDVHGRIVVGIDGSKNSIRALVWAMHNASEDQVIEAVLTWNYIGAVLPEAAALAVDQFETAAHETLSETIAGALDIAVGQRSKIIPLVLQGDPRYILRERSKNADLLVVGARGHQGFAHAILGSVATSLVHKPIAVTIVVPSPDR